MYSSSLEDVGVSSTHFIAHISLAAIIEAIEHIWIAFDNVPWNCGHPAVAAALSTATAYGPTTATTPSIYWGSDNFDFLSRMPSPVVPLPSFLVLRTSHMKRLHKGFFSDPPEVLEAPTHHPEIISVDETPSTGAHPSNTSSHFKHPIPWTLMTWVVAFAMATFPLGQTSKTQGVTLPASPKSEDL
ncbi:hypothetical protein EDB89DRAFT_1907149, partial [Lactarius sanguifluus]